MVSSYILYYKWNFWPEKGGREAEKKRKVWSKDLLMLQSAGTFVSEKEKGGRKEQDQEMHPN